MGTDVNSKRAVFARTAVMCIDFQFNYIYFNSINSKEYAISTKGL